MSQDSDVKVAFQEHPIADVMGFYIRSFKLKDGMKLKNAEWFYDAAKGVVVFKLMIGGVSGNIVSLRN